MGAAGSALPQRVQVVIEWKGAKDGEARSTFQTSSVTPVRQLVEQYYMSRWSSDANWPREMSRSEFLRRVRAYRDVDCADELDVRSLTAAAVCEWLPPPGAYPATAGTPGTLYLSFDEAYRPPPPPVDDNARKRWRESDEAAAAVAQSQLLHPDWRVAHDEGRPYFWHKPSEEVTWDRPQPLGVVGYGVLRVTLRRAVGLPSASADPYVLLDLGGKVGRSATAASTRNPVWDEDFEFEGDFEELCSQPLVLDVRDAASVVKLKDDESLGALSLRLEGLRNTSDGKLSEMDVEETLPSAGVLLFRVQWLSYHDSTLAADRAADAERAAKVYRLGHLLFELPAQSCAARVIDIALCSCAPPPPPLVESQATDDSSHEMGAAGNLMTAAAKSAEAASKIEARAARIAAKSAGAAVAAGRMQKLAQTSKPVPPKLSLAKLREAEKASKAKEKPKKRGSR